METNTEDGRRHWELGSPLTNDMTSPLLLWKERDILQTVTSQNLSALQATYGRPWVQTPAPNAEKKKEEKEYAKQMWIAPKWSMFLSRFNLFYVCFTLRSEGFKSYWQSRPQFSTLHQSSRSPQWLCGIFISNEWKDKMLITIWKP